MTRQTFEMPIWRLHCQMCESFVLMDIGDHHSWYWKITKRHYMNNHKRRQDGYQLAKPHTINFKTFDTATTVQLHYQDCCILTRCDFLVSGKPVSIKWPADQAGMLEKPQEWLRISLRVLPGKAGVKTAYHIEVKVACIITVNYRSELATLAHHSRTCCESSLTEIWLCWSFIRVWKRCWVVLVWTLLIHQDQWNQAQETLKRFLPHPNDHKWIMLSLLDTFKESHDKIIPDTILQFLQTSLNLQASQDCTLDLFEMCLSISSNKWWV